jgi:hypothetical protein
MKFKVTARRFGNSVKFFIEADSTKLAFQDALKQANTIFDFKTGEAGAPTVSVDPIEEKD